ncbi:MAG: di-heme oxidoredictase family protein [Kofleriaceae bacterium]
MRVAFLLVVVIACGDNIAGEDQAGGEHATISDRSEFAFTHPLPSLDAEQLDEHNLGRGPFRFEWTPPQLGRLFNNRSCVACHIANGRGLSQIGPDVFGSQALIRVSLPEGTPSRPGGNVPVPDFGEQLQDHATFGVPEVRVAQTWIDLPDMLGDGEVVMLREPRLSVTAPGMEPLPAMLMSFRQAPPLVGMALLEAIPDDALLAAADPDDADGDGISGRVNYAWDEQSQTTQLGRFGWKASVPRLVEQAAGAFVNDMGLTNLIFPEPDGSRDVNDTQLVQVRFHIATLAVPAAARRDDLAERGRELFDSLGCASCHTQVQQTGASDIPQLAHQIILPYTDLLLHDMGDRLTDTRRDFLASGLEWRTPPLWGIGLTQIVEPGATFLHDGRARTLTEAIVWHGGEAEVAREAFRTADRADREALLAFLATL